MAGVKIGRLITACWAVALAGLAVPGGAQPLTHGIAMHGAPALAPDFAHLPYVNPNAPRGGRLTLGLIGSFDSLNPFIPRGQAVGAVRTLVYESLLVRNLDEPFALYGLLAERIEVPEDRSSITFHLNPAARFADGRPVTVEDVAFSLALLRDTGWPNLRTYYSKVLRTEPVGPRGIRFVFGAGRDAELPLILGLMPVLPRHAIVREDFERTSFDKPLGSGPYRVGEVEPGAAVTFVRNPDWWARDLPIARGQFNVDELRYEFYRDQNSLFEAFKKGLVDVRSEDDPTRWATGYDFPAVQDGRVVLETFPIGLPRPMNAFVFNTRRAPLSDIRVRRALIALFDFEWINANLYAGGYRRTVSFFEGSELSALARPAGPGERTLLARFPDAVPPDILEGQWRLAPSDGSGFDRTRVRRALEALSGAGWSARGGRLVNAQGQPFQIELMVLHAEHERVALAWKRVLDRVGIDLSIRRVDSAQWERRRQTFDYDLMPWAWAGTLSPGNEQAFRWGSAAADQPGSLNLAGVRSPAVDAAVEALVGARSREDLVAAARALDRLLMAGAYVLPLYHIPEQRLARWAGLGRPERPALPGQVYETWWRNPE